MYIKVHVFPGSKREKIIEKGELYELHVKEKAEMNRANKRVREIIAERFSVQEGGVRMLSGHRSPKKLFSIDEQFVK